DALSQVWERVFSGALNLLTKRCALFRTAARSRSPQGNTSCRIQLIAVIAAFTAYRGMDKTFTKIPITKLEAARRQIETAITLWFSESDPVSIHTLVSAAHRLVYDINSKSLGLPMLGDTTNIRPGREKEYR